MVNPSSESPKLPGGPHFQGQGTVSFSGENSQVFALLLLNFRSENLGWMNFLEKIGAVEVLKTKETTSTTSCFFQLYRVCWWVDELRGHWKWGTTLCRLRFWGQWIFLDGAVAATKRVLEIEGCVSNTKNSYGHRVCCEITVFCWVSLIFWTWKRYRCGPVAYMETVAIGVFQAFTFLDT